MPIKDSAKKALKSSAKKRVFNLRRKISIKSISREVGDLVSAGKKGKRKKKYQNSTGQLIKLESEG